MATSSYISLGKTGITISSIGLGTMNWRNHGEINEGDIRLSSKPSDIYETSISMGINFFDTAEIYGHGKSESLLGTCVRGETKNVVLASKFMPFPWRFFKGELRSALLRSLARLGVDRIDLYQVHWPFPPVSISTWMDAMSDLVVDGLIRAVGVSNYSVGQTRKAYEFLAKHNIPLASNQVKFNLLDRRVEQSGLLHLCNELGITLIAYSPLETGILSGKYSSLNLPPDFRSWRYNKAYLKKIEPLLTELKVIGERYCGKTSGQVALNWLRAKGAVPIPGAKNVDQANDTACALTWELSEEDVARLDLISQGI